jgi:FkbM family methyltransferase
MKNFIWHIFYVITGNKLLQRILDWNIKISRLLMGIGSGVYPEHSGESKIGDVLIKSSDIYHTLVVFDVGANRGQFLDILLKRITARAFIIHTFEPSKDAFGYLKNNHSQINGIVFNNFGLDDAVNDSPLYFDELSSLRASKHPINLNHIGVKLSSSEVVHFDTLDHYCKKNKIEDIDLLKLDVEGNELNVLMGGQDILNKGGIRFISFEFGEPHIDSRTSFKDLYYFLVDKHMQALYRITPTGYLFPISGYSEKLEMYFSTNYLAKMN